jgi:hypothetical protein
VTAPVVLHANTDLVAVAWVAGTPGFVDGMVSTRLPSPPGSWADTDTQVGTGFVTVRPAGTGKVTPAYGLYGPVITLDAYAYKVGSSKPQWNKANNLLMAVVDATHDYNAPARDVTLPGGYPPARVTGAWVTQMPRRAYGDAGNYAHFTMDLSLSWVELPASTP